MLVSLIVMMMVYVWELTDMICVPKLDSYAVPNLIVLMLLAVSGPAPTRLLDI